MTTRERMYNLIFPERMRLIRKGRCPNCRQWIADRMIQKMSLLSLHEFVMSGECEICSVYRVGDKEISWKIWEEHGLSHVYSRVKGLISIVTEPKALKAEGSVH